jgi:hypothetical protein
VDEVVKGIFSFVISMPDNRDEIAELVEGHFVLLNKWALLEDLPDERDFVVRTVEAHNVEVGVIDVLLQIQRSAL